MWLKIRWEILSIGTIATEFSSRFEATIVEVVESERGLNYEVADFRELIFEGK